MEEGGDNKVEELDGDSEEEPFSGPSSLNTTRGRLLTSGNLQEGDASPSNVAVQCTLREHPGNILGTIGAHSGKIQ
jgi:hypothetical protein